LVNREYQTDFLIIGSGAGGLCAALTARSLGARVLVLEKNATIGGNSALSGGTMWIPGNPLMREEGIDDSIEEGLTYLNACISDPGPSSSQARLEKYLSEGVHMIEFLREKGIAMRRVKGYADYYAELPGGNIQGRALQCNIFDLSELGPHAKLVPWSTPVIAYVEEAPEMARMLRSWRGFKTTLHVLARTAWAKVRGRPLVANGAALIGRLLQAGLHSSIELWTESPVEEIIIDDDGRVKGVQALYHGEKVTIWARYGVLIACGGYARNLEMLKRYGRQPASVDWTLANPGETGEVIQMAMRLGAATDLMDEAIWMPMAVLPSGPQYIVMERGLPHCILVDGEGRRYIDEGASYMTIPQKMYERHKHIPTIPSWFILDSRHRRRYPFGLAPPGFTPKEWFQSGFMKRANTIRELAGLCGINAETLELTVKRFNYFATTGIDEDFHRGETNFSRQPGDPRQRPNPVLGSIERPPFYAVAIYPGNLGTFGGILTDEHARVLRHDGSVIEGLYATGNATAPVMGRIYPCTGASIASTMIFGFVAAQHAIGNKPPRDLN
jgi:3-oxosteroid 1-dehydrogenase